MIYVNKADSAPLYQQLYTSIIEEITNGSLPKNSALPPIRTLSEKLNISLNTVQKTSPMKPIRWAWEPESGAASKDLKKTA